ncbi:TPR repeat-containing protein yrrB [Porphyromonas macacae]|uniref:TPR repeat-containing protein yrrB n=1 Tax=Porphyromonas macacae TaxID=28115 RepID=A0A379E8D9_9PORP|nr:tetratricopeptide repeat protein [Porphyromonas macacae]SUB88622.1 TPR repeat-containing protein yrrB [Porphyromonas macacae]
MKRSSALLLSLTVMLFVLLSASKCNNKPAKSAKEEAIELYEKGLCFHNQGDLNNALRHYTFSIEKDSSISSVFTNRSGVKAALGDTAGAYSDCSKALQIDSVDVIALNNMGALYGGKKEYDKAKLFFLKAIKADSLYVNPYYSLGLIFYETHQYNKAICYLSVVEKLEKSMESGYLSNGLYRYMMPDYYDIRAFSYYFLGLCYKRMGNMEKAVDYLRLAEEENVTGAADSLKTITRK